MWFYLRNLESKYNKVVILKSNAIGNNMNGFHIIIMVKCIKQLSFKSTRAQDPLLFSWKQNKDDKKEKKYFSHLFLEQKLQSFIM